MVNDRFDNTEIDEGTEFYDDERDGYDMVLCNLRMGEDKINSLNEISDTASLEELRDELVACVEGTYFWSKNMIVLKALSGEEVSQQLVDLYENCRSLRSAVNAITRPREDLKEDLSELEFDLAQFIKSENVIYEQGVISDA